MNKIGLKLLLIVFHQVPLDSDQSDNGMGDNDHDDVSDHQDDDSCTYSSESGMDDQEHENEDTDD